MGARAVHRPKARRTTPWRVKSTTGWGRLRTRRARRAWRALALSGAGDGMLLCHDLVAGKCVYGLGANRGAVRCIHAAPDGLVAAGDDGNAIVYSF